MQETNKKKVAWLIPPPTDAGQGGYRTILALAQALEKSGTYTSTLAIVPFIPADLDQAHERISTWYGFDFEHIVLANELDSFYDAVIATFWITAQVAAALPIPKKFYLCQDYEPLFYPMGSDYLEAERSYRLELQPLCLGRWLTHTVNAISPITAHSFDFGANQEIYHPNPDIQKERAICSIFQPEKPRRLTKLMAETCEVLQQIAPDIKVYLFGSNNISNHIQTKNVCDLGILSTKELNELYNRTSLGISLSCTNPSRIPFEMLASGLPVVELDLPSNQLDLPQDAVSLAAYNPLALAQKIKELLDAPQKLERMHQSGIAFMKNRTEAAEHAEFVSIFNKSFSSNVATVSHATQSPEEALIHKRTLEELNLECTQNVIWHARWISMKLQGLSQQDQEIYIYRWSAPNQSDMQVSTFKTAGAPNCMLGCTLPEAPEAHPCHIHVYTRRNNKMELLGAISQMIDTSEPTYPGRTRTCTWGDVTATVEALA